MLEVFIQEGGCVKCSGNKPRRQELDLRRIQCRYHAVVRKGVRVWKIVPVVASTVLGEVQGGGLKLVRRGRAATWPILSSYLQATKPGLLARTA